MPGSVLRVWVSLRKWTREEPREAAGTAGQHVSL